MNNISQPKSYSTLIKISIFLLIFGGCYYYFASQPDCIKMTADGSLKCRCFFNTADEWKKFKEDTRGLNGDGWESVVVKEDPCKTASYIKLKKDFYGDNKNSLGNSTIIDCPKMAVDTPKMSVPVIKNDTPVTNIEIVKDKPDTDSNQNIRYKVIAEKAYFYNVPGDVETKRKGYLVKGENIIALKDSLGFVYCEFTNSITNKMSKGWISKELLR